MSTPETQATTVDTREIASGVRQVAVGAPFTSYVYLLDSPDGTIAFDAGIRGTGPAILAEAGGQVAKVILSHSHADHRGAASELGAPIYCHPDEVADMEAAWPQPYIDFSQIGNQRVREGLPLLNEAWDGGPVAVTGTVQAGDAVAGMRVLHVPGHAPGEIALFRESDGLLIAGDAIYTVDLESGQPVPARVPHPATNWNTDLARASICSLIGLGATSVWAGHSENVTGDVSSQLERAATFGLE